MLLTAAYPWKLWNKVSVSISLDFFSTMTISALVTLRLEIFFDKFHFRTFEDASGLYSLELQTSADSLYKPPDYFQNIPYLKEITIAGNLGYLLGFMFLLISSPWTKKKRFLMVFNNIKNLYLRLCLYIYLNIPKSNFYFCSSFQGSSKNGVIVV